MTQKSSATERKEFGARVKAAREKRRMDAEAAAKHLEISSSHLYSVEAGRSNTSPALRKRLEGFIAAAAAEQPAATGRAEDDVMPVVRVLALLQQTKLSAAEFAHVVDAYRACTAFGLAFGADQAKQVLAKAKS